MMLLPFPSLPRAATPKAWRLVLLSALLLTPGLLQAHPHGWIDLSVRVQLDEQGRIEGLRQSWRMDPFYSLVVLEELEHAGGEEGLQAGLDQLGGEIRDNLSRSGYFTELTLGSERLALAEVEEYTVLARGGRVEFVFLLPLEAPRGLEGETLRYQVFDPTYYLEVVHEAEGGELLDTALTVSGDLACTTRILPAEPDPERVAEAAMLDKTDEAEPGLGRYFAETGEVTCD